MKLFCSLMLLGILSVTVHAQVPGDAIAPEDIAFNTTYASRSIPKVTGKLLNMTPDDWQKVQITYILVTPFAHSQVTKTTAANADGTFNLQLDYPLPYQQIWFSVGDYFYAGLYANSDLDIQLDMTKIKAAKGVQFNGDGVHYGGTDGPLNTYLNNYILYRRPEQQQLINKISQLIYYSHTPVDSILPTYNGLCDSIKQIQDSYIATNPSPYDWILENERLSEYYGQICTKYLFKIMPDSLWQKIKKHKSYLVSNSSTAFYRCQSMYIGYQAGPKPASMIQLLDRNIQKTDSLLPSARADYLKLTMSYTSDLTEQMVELDHILNSMHTGWCMAIVKSQAARTITRVNEINATLAKATLAQASSGSPNPSFGKPLIETSFGASLFEAPDVKAADFMSKLVRAFPGKAIIIDRWATWCGACIGEMPHSKELQQQSKDLPVVFVYLCSIVNSTEDKWKSKVMEMEQPGVHILINEMLDADLSRYFAFSGYPGYAFIDKAGSYKPGAITWMSQIENKQALATLVTTK